MSETIKATIKELQGQLRALDEEAIQIKTTINLLCKRGGMDPIYAEPDGSSFAAGAGDIKGDTFYGQPLNSCIRDYLERRKTAGLGPATAREIFQALSQGGFQFNAKSEENAMRSLRITLSKATHTFHKLPNGSFGLLRWYPTVKPAKPVADDEPDADADDERVADLEAAVEALNVEKKGGNNAAKESSGPNRE
jgi:hypothetical protein